MIKKLAVLGSPIEHSKSPQIQLVALNSLGVEATFERVQVTNLGEFLSETRESFDALSLTMPLKEQAVALADWVDPLAEKVHAANYLIRNGNEWRAYNTDVFGIRKATEAVPAKTVGILGTGATARSALAAFDGKTTLLWGRNATSAEELSHEFGASSANLSSVLSCDLVVSTLPADALATLAGATQPGVLLDVVYSRPSPSGFSEYISGLQMLVWQAIGQLRILINGSEQPLDNEGELARIMLRAAEVAE